MTPDQLRARRTALGLTQQQFADALGVSRTTVMRWETGAVDFSQFRWLSLALEALEGRAQWPRIEASLLLHCDILDDLAQRDRALLPTERGDAMAGALFDLRYYIEEFLAADMEEQEV